MDEDLSQPVLPGRGASDYERYLRTDDLLALQKRPEEQVHRDELLFQVVHQSSELWLKLAGAEIEEATSLLRRERIAAALRLLRRASHCLELITDQLEMLEHLSPWEYQEIRKVLGHGSGFDSPGFVRLRELSPRLGSAFEELLRRAGLDLVRLYREARDHEALYELAEALIEWDERLSVWRYRHYKVISRIIGAHVVGTQGTPVEVLGKLIKQRLYPELWDVRDRLTELSIAEGSSMEERQPETQDDPTRHSESPTTPPGEDSGEERAEKVAGRDKDVSDDESYEGGLPA